MASAAPTASHHEAMITLKVAYDGVVRRTKMPLREMAPQTLESNIRTFLQIPADAETLIERYSDSGASYVELDPKNVAVYKQLYRAAKAKSKLKIRVTLKDETPKTAPKPVTVEDEPEVPASSSSTLDASTEGAPVPEKPQEEAKEHVEEQTEEQDATSPPTSDSVPDLQPVETALPIRSSNPSEKSASSIQKTYDSALLQSAAQYVNENKLDLRKIFDRQMAEQVERQRAILKSLYKPHAEAPAASCSRGASTPVSQVQNPAVCPATGVAFAVCCNSCEKTIPDVHYHCSTCDDGDFDLCQSCVFQGITCYSNSHWLIKRQTVNGQIVNSTTETIVPTLKAKRKAKPENQVQKVERSTTTSVSDKDSVTYQLPPPQIKPRVQKWEPLGNMRTCNCCVREFPEREFLHCTACEDFDLCQPCFAKDGHGHHPQHAFVPAVEGTKMPDHIKVRLGPGRNTLHHATCDGCDKTIRGVRHKCLDCPDWDFCSACMLNAKFVHTGHRFAPIYEQLPIVCSYSSPPVHVGICCDGPLCSTTQGYPSYIRGIRYKCAVCNDLDFCANCEASPSNQHNKTHPLIKFRTPVRHVSVTTTGEHQNGRRMPNMGDRSPSPKPSEPVAASQVNAMNTVQTVLDVKPVEPTPALEEIKAPEPETKEPEIKEEPKEDVKEELNAVPEKEKEESTPTSMPLIEKDLKAVFLRETVPDGTILPPDRVFEQTWVLRNEGNVAWPAGCAVKFVGGDYMGHVDSNHPAGISELVSASESTVCYAPLAPGQEFPFTVLLRTPARAGKIISYWRLTTPDGLKFGHRLWCDVNVRALTPKPEEKSETIETKAPVEEPKNEEDSQASSQMIFPKLEKESPMASMHESAPSEHGSLGPAPMSEVEGFEVCTEVGDWDGSDDEFMTDEEYDILDASDEEYLEEQLKHMKKPARK